MNLSRNQVKYLWAFGGRGSREREILGISLPMKKAKMGKAEMRRKGALHFRSIRFSLQIGE